jgi:hypothetical protein
LFKKAIKMKQFQNKKKHSRVLDTKRRRKKEREREREGEKGKEQKREKRTGL